jgi:hypothetical protein
LHSFHCNSWDCVPVSLFGASSSTRPITSNARSGRGWLRFEVTLFRFEQNLAKILNVLDSSKYVLRSVSTHVARWKSGVVGVRS